MGDNNIKTTLNWVIGISSITLILLVFLVIFGNLSGNLGITTTSDVVTINESGFINTTGYTPTGVSNLGYLSYVITNVWGNCSNVGAEFIIPASNYTITANKVYNVTGTLDLVANGYKDVCITYTTTSRSGEYNQAESVITNYSSGINKLTSQIPTILLFVGIGLLLFVLIGVLAYVIRKMSNLGGKSNNLE
jgi:hypothetical protein